MSIEVRIPKEIMEYKEKILFGLTIRQLLCFALAIILGTASYFLFKSYIGKDAAGYLVILEVLPIFAIGFFKKSGFTFENYMRLILKHKLGRNIRKYQPQLSFNTINNKTEEGKNVKPIYKKKSNREGEKSVFEITKADCKRKCKEVKRKIADARKEFNRAKKEVKKAAPKAKSTQECSTINKI